jgi:hypothetical protein
MKWLSALFSVVSNWSQWKSAWEFVSSWVRSWSTRGVIIALVVGFILYGILFGSANATEYDLISPDGMTVQAVPREQIRPEPFFIEMNENNSVLFCYPYDPVGEVFVCKWGTDADIQGQ